MTSKLMKLHYPKFSAYSLNRIKQILKSGRVNYWTGNECKKFEKEFSKYIGNKLFNYCYQW